MQNLFEQTTPAIKRIFTGNAATNGQGVDALKTIEGHFVAIGEILVKAGVPAQLCELAVQDLLAAQLMVNRAVTFGNA